MKTPEEIIKEKYPFYDENYTDKDVELDGKQVTELMIRYADQFKQVKVGAEVKPACEFTQEHFSTVGRAVEKWIKQDLVVEGKDMIGKKEGAKTLRERINEELSKSV